MAKLFEYRIQDVNDFLSLSIHPIAEVAVADKGGAYLLRGAQAVRIPGIGCEQHSIKPTCLSETTPNALDYPCNSFKFFLAKGDAPHALCRVPVQ